MKSELLETLLIVDATRSPVSAAQLCETFGCSVATLKRRLADARTLGAHVESVKLGGRWVYHLANEPMVCARLAKWIQLEESRSLLA